jgi:hypothetical protein
MMLPPERIPSQEHVDRVNALIHQRCTSSKNLHLLRLTEWSTAMRAGTPVVINGVSHKYSKSELFISDGLHVNRRGLALMTLLTLEALIKNKVLPRSAIYCSDPEVLSERLKGCRLEVRIEDTKGNKIREGEVTFDITNLRALFPATEFEDHRRLAKLTESHDLQIRNPFFIRGLPGALIGKTLVIRNVTTGSRSAPFKLRAGSTRAVITLQ